MVAAIILVLTKGAAGEAYNAGGDEIVNINEVIGYMAQADERIISHIVEKEVDGDYSFSKGKGVNCIMLDNNKIKTLGWKQLFSNREGFTRMIGYYLSQKHKM